MTKPIDLPRAPGRVVVAGAPAGVDAITLGRFARGRDLVFIARDDGRQAQIAEALAFFAPKITCLTLPAWDCLPYDRVSPSPGVMAQRIDTLGRLATADAGQTSAGRVILTTVAAALQKLPPPEIWARERLVLRPGETIAPDRLIETLQRHGYARVETVTEAGDFAVRGGIIDLFPPGREQPVRLDFFGDDIETVRAFDAETQRTAADAGVVTIQPVSEVSLDEESIRRFRVGYRELFGNASLDDPLYDAVSAGRRQAGIEHWLPLFHQRLVTLFDYVGAAGVILDQQIEEAIDARLQQVGDYHEARGTVDVGRLGAGMAPYHPVPVEQLFLDRAAWDAVLSTRPVASLSGFALPPAPHVLDAGGRPGLDFVEARKRTDTNLFEVLAQRIGEQRQAGRRVIFAAVSRGSRERLMAVLAEHRVAGTVARDDWPSALATPAGQLPVIVLPIDRGFVLDQLLVITEQDLLGDRIARRAKRVRADNFLTEATSLATGDLVVHVDHGIGRYEGLETLSVDAARHDCLRLIYAGGDKLFLPVENIEMISRFGSDAEAAGLDRLGGAAWQGRKARLKQRIREIAGELVKTAAARALKSAPPLKPADGAFDEFCARFPYDETDDQARAIGEVLEDLDAGRPADRLICGDVGFGKTEVALRAAFVTALEGKQVAVVVPTTLLCRQHYRTFIERFAGFPVRIEELSRLVPPKQVKQIKAGLRKGGVDIIIGTHALLAKDIAFRDLGLLVIDEEQHFGVTHKERLKKLKADVHVLTLTATPIPRTLQMALSGVRELSLIATPPVDRLSVRTFVGEFDPVVIRDAILREHFRGGQTFYVCPRIEDLDDVRTMLTELVPEVSLVTVHGRLAPKDMEDAIGAFNDRSHNVLLSTNIIESGLDMPAVNTIVIHRADMFGLAQLYQLRGRVGRGKVRAFAYLTLPPGKKLTPAAEKRLTVMHGLDSLGAGFALASHDLDIRGAGNLLGDEQSGHIREVGIELYQQMLEEAVAEARGGEGVAAGEEEWSPQIALGLSVLIPETYVPDLGLRLGLYRRLGDLKSREEIEAFAAELVDRFGPAPPEVNNLLAVVAIKKLCREANVERLEAGPKGASLTFRASGFPNPPILVQFIARHGHHCTLRPDMKLVYRSTWERPEDRLTGTRALLAELARLARPGATLPPVKAKPLPETATATTSAKRPTAEPKSKGKPGPLARERLRQPPAKPSRFTRWFRD